MIQKMGLASFCIAIRCKSHFPFLVRFWHHVVGKKMRLPWYPAASLSTRQGGSGIHFNLAVQVRMHQLDAQVERLGSEPIEDSHKCLDLGEWFMPHLIENGVGGI
jgi:hypothetical protein